MEDLTPHDDSDAPAASPRLFGMLMGGIFLFIALIPLATAGSVRIWSLVLGGAFVGVAWVAPVLLRGLLKLWLGLGTLLSRVISPIALGIIFFGVFTLYGGLLRLLGRDPMKRRREPALASYWIDRTPEQRQVNFDNQF